MGSFNLILGKTTVFLFRMWRVFLSVISLVSFVSTNKLVHIHLYLPESITGAVNLEGGENRGGPPPGKEIDDIPNYDSEAGFDYADEISEVDNNPEEISDYEQTGLNNRGRGQTEGECSSVNCGQDNRELPSELEFACCHQVMKDESIMDHADHPFIPQKYKKTNIEGTIHEVKNTNVDSKVGDICKNVRCEQSSQNRGGLVITCCSNSRRRRRRF